MKKNKKNNSGKTSIQSRIRMAQISKYEFNEILPTILIRKGEGKKKIKKKKQNNENFLSR